MTYSKRFFFIVTLVTGLAVVAVDRILWKWMPPVVSSTILFVGLCAMAVGGRYSGTLADRFARLFGRVVFLRPVRTLAQWILRREISTLDMTETPLGLKEIAYEQFDYGEVLGALGQLQIVQEAWELDTSGLSEYLDAARYEEYYPSYFAQTPEYLVRKQIQHYLSCVLTPIEGWEIWMDVASSSSPFPDILTRLYGISVYRQDLSYPSGVRGLFIGSDAASIPLPNAYIDRVSLHCSFEHFEKGSDVGFLHELSRVLRPGGTACIIPLYLSNTYQILTNPRYWPSRGVPKEEGARISICCTYWESHGRFYDAEALRRRVFEPLRAGGLDYRLIQVRVPPELEYPPFVVLEIKKP